MLRRLTRTGVPVVLTFLASLAALLRLSAQETETVLRVTTRLVQVNVIVENTKGEPVPGLTADDFRVLENGKEQTIGVFSVQDNRLSQKAEAEVPQNVFSNRLDRASGTSGSVTVILLDGLNTPFEDQAYAKQQVVKFLQELRPDDRVAIYTLGRGLRVLHDFTTDARPLLAALARHRGAPSGHLIAEADLEGLDENRWEQLDRWLQVSSGSIRDFQTRRRVMDTLEALEAIANHLARFPGRKNLVWVTAAFPFSLDSRGFAEGHGTVAEAFGLSRQIRWGGADSRTFQREVEKTVRALNGANLAVYPVDARGLMGAFRAQRYLTPAGHPTTALDRRLQGLIYFDEVETIGTMRHLADHTGGVAAYNTNDLAGALRRAMEDAQLTYGLGYYRPGVDWDGGYRKIQVRVRRPGLRVRHRQGYFAQNPPQLKPQEREEVLRVAARSPLEASGLGLVVRLAGDPDPRERKIPLQVSLNGRDLTLQPRGDRWEGALDLLYVQLCAEGKELEGQTQAAELSLKENTYRKILASGLTLDSTQQVSPKAAQLRIVARDRATGALGSVTISLSRFFPAGGK